MKRRTEFRGYDWNAQHYVTPRRAYNYYPDDDSGDAFVGRIALAIVVILAVIALWWSL